MLTHRVRQRGVLTRGTVVPDHTGGRWHCAISPRRPRRSISDVANACAAQHDHAVHHRLNQERRATARISLGSDLALARTRCLKKSRASSDHLPPVSQARTTKRARPCSALNSGYLRSLVRRARSRLSPWGSIGSTGLTKVTSMANWAQGKRGKPSATTHRRRSSNRPPGKRSRSWSRMLVDTLAPASLQMRAAQLPSGYPRHPSKHNVAHGARWWARESIGLATPSACGRKGEPTPQAAQEEDAETMRIQARS